MYRATFYSSLARLFKSCGNVGGRRAKPNELPGPVGDSTLAQVVGCEFDLDLITSENSDVILAHFPRNMRRDDVAVFQFYTKSRVGQGIDNLTLHLNLIFFCHAASKPRERRY